MITVFTPAHKFVPEYFRDAARSLENQTSKNFEWLVLLNGEALNHEEEIRKITKIARIERSELSGVGALKHECCRLAEGSILLELDFDDWLGTTAIAEVEAAFADPEVMFAYSDFVRITQDGDTLVYPKTAGWKSYRWGPYEVNQAFPATPQYLRNIQWAPNHLRAFRRSAYDLIEYDHRLYVGDDFDLIVRFYLKFGVKAFRHINKPLYIYREHSANTHQELLSEVHSNVDKTYVKYAELMYMKWADEQGLAKLDLGGAFNCPIGYTSVDIEGADIEADLEKPWPFEDNSVGVVRAYHILEHLEDPIHFFNEAYRVLAPGGFLLIEVPSVNGAGAFADPTHKKFFNQLSFEYYTNLQYARFIRAYKGKFQMARIVEFEWSNPRIPIIGAHMIALKGDYDENWCGFRYI
jgi:O-antigen biosynthesis protein